jgi:hypothetical protein
VLQDDDEFVVFIVSLLPTVASASIFVAIFKFLVKKRQKQKEAYTKKKKLQRKY